MAGTTSNDYGDLLTRYEALVDSGTINADPAQRRVARHLARLQFELENLRFATKSSSLGWFFAKRSDANPLKGAYIHGGVGRGKTMLMDLFYECAPDLPKRRVHFQEFMAQTHELIHEHRQQEKQAGHRSEDPIVPVAMRIADTARLLCFDEFQVTDITDAMILGRLFAKLFARRVIVVATSNTEPQDLYKDGLNRALFLPFVDLIRERLNILHLDSRTDYRLDRLGGSAVYFCPLNERTSQELDAIWEKLTSGQSAPLQIELKGRQIRVPLAGMGAARFSFADLCEQPLGSADYLKLARSFHTVMVDRIPVMSADKRNEARRFIHLIDALYDNRVKLIASAQAEPAALYAEGDGADAFMRTASRLIEMRSASYLALPHGRTASTERQDTEQAHA